MMKSKLVGVTMGNEQRQENVLSLSPGQRIWQVYETDNPFDPNAIKLFADEARTKPLGYLKKELAADLTAQKAKGWSYIFYCEDITGQEKQAHGCNIRIEATRVA
jgi:hypothetical protein